MYPKQVPDLSEISGFSYEWDFDEESYQEWLEENEYSHNDETFMEYVIDNVTFTLHFYDHETAHYMTSIDLFYDDVVTEYGEKIANEMVDVLGNQGKNEGSFDKMDLLCDDFDINNPYELNKVAVTALPHGKYRKDGRGFILTNGVFVYTEGEHNECNIIPGVNGTFHFIKLGNIRVLPQSIDIPNEPTWEQEKTLEEIIECYKNEILYVTLFDKRGEHDVRFYYPQPERVINEINRFFRDGIIPTGESFHEKKSYILKGGLFGRINLNEGVESKNMSLAKHYLYKQLNCNEADAMKYIGAIKTQIPNSRLAKCKYILAMVRMWLNHELDQAETIAGVNRSLRYAASDAHINEYDNNLNNLSADDFIKKFASFAQQDLEQDKQDVAAQDYEENSNYYIVKIDSFEEAEQYGEYVDWCVTHDKEMFNNYTSNGTGVFYFCLREGWEEQEEVRGENCPLDEYGLSMIAVSVNRDGSSNTITCRWNHANGGNDTIMTPKELSAVINRNFYDIFKPLTEEEIKRNQQEVLEEIREEIHERMDWYDFGLDGIADPLIWDYEGKLLDENPFEEDEENDIDVSDYVLYYRYDTGNGQSVLLDSQGEIALDIVAEEIDSYVMENNRYFFCFTHNMGNYTLVNDHLKILGSVKNFWRDRNVIQFRNNTDKWNMMDVDGNVLLDNWFDTLDGPRFGGENNDRYFFFINRNEDGVLKENIFDIYTKKPVFDKPVASFNRRMMDDYGFIFLRFEGDNFSVIYDVRNEIKLKAPWKVLDFRGFVSWDYGKDYNYMYGCSVHLDDNKTYYMDDKCNLWRWDVVSKRENGTAQFEIVKYNPYESNIQFKESRNPRTIREILSEATDGQFSTQELTNLRSFEEKLRYCQHHLGKYIGKGSSRIVYQIDDEKVLKLAWNKKGLWQNSEEASWFKKNYDIFPKIYEYDDNNYQWIICEYVLPANAKDFKYCLGLSWKDFRIFVTTASSQYGDPENKLISTQDFIDLCKEEPFLDELNRYMCDYCLNTFYDLCDLANWGLTQRNGNARLVLLDHGINDVIYNKFYS